jgi:FkbM family methyltransferase
LIRNLFRHLLPADPASFVAVLPTGGRIVLRYREVLGMSTLLYGGFESVETHLLSRLAPAGSTAIDVGANVGLFTVVLGRAVGPKGRVWAFEPHPGNRIRLIENLRLNQLDNVEVVEVAIGSSDGAAVLHVGSDPAYHSTVAVRESKGTGQSLNVRAERLDTVWRRFASPQVSVLKIDVEGGEMDVLEGAAELVSQCQPILMVEAPELDKLAQVFRWLAPRGYVERMEPGLQPWNHVFVAMNRIDNPITE